MEKVAVIGSGGSGKSRFSLILGEKLNLPVYHLDQLYWKPNWTKTNREEWTHIQRNLCEKEHWIIDGNYQSTLDIRLEACDTVIFLDVNRFKCIYRVLKRTMFSSNRSDMAVGCSERFDLDFIRFLWRYPKVSKPEIIKKLNALSEYKTVIIAKSGKEVLNHSKFS